MSAVRALPGCRLVRPLLAVPRTRLAALLAAESQPFLEDPSNTNPAFERARLRLRFEAEGASNRTAGILPTCRLEAGAPNISESLDAGQKSQLGNAVRCMGQQRIVREGRLDALLGCAVALHPAGFAAIDAAVIAAADNELAERLLARVAGCIGSGRYPARRDRVARLRHALMLMPRRARTLGGCRFVPWRGRVLVVREPAAASPPRPLEPGENVHWDRRFVANLPEDAPGALTLGYLGQRGQSLSKRYSGDVPRLIHPVLPAFWDAAGLVAVPSLGYRRSGIEAAPCVLFRPAHPLSQAGFTVV
jgi:tRNA(Ile)-lysidine synthase